MANACHEGLIAKFDQLISKLQTRIMKKERLQVSENGTYTAPENTGYTVVDVNVTASAPLNLQPMKEAIIETPNQGFSGVTVTPDEGYDGLESVKCFAPTVELAAEENGTYEARVNNVVGFYKVTAAVPNIPRSVRGSGRVNTSTKTFQNTSKQSMMSQNTMEVDELPLPDDATKLRFYNGSLFGFFTYIIGGNNSSCFVDDQTEMRADIELWNGDTMIATETITFDYIECHGMAISGNVSYEGMYTFQTSIRDSFTKEQVMGSTKAVLRKIYCEVVPAFAPVIIDAGAYVYVTAVLPEYRA